MTMEQYTNFHAYSIVTHSSENCCANSDIYFMISLIYHKRLLFTGVMFSCKR